ncbi:MAG: carbohydrate ABC transporter permease [Faecalibacterium sp.]
MSTKPLVNNKIRVSAGDRFITVVMYVLVGAFAICCLLPFILVISASFTDEVALVKQGYHLWPTQFSTSAYGLLAQTSDVLQAYKVTIFITVVGTLCSMLFTCAIAYTMSVRTFRSRGALSMFCYFTMLFNGGLVSTYLMLTKVLNLRNNILVLILPGMLGAYNIFLMRNFFSGIPQELSEAAKLDGASDMTILFRIILPISTPGIATVGLFYALGYWNEWYKCMLYISNEKLYTLQYLIMKIMREINYASTVPSDITLYQGALPTYSFRMAAVVAAIGPIVLLYPFVQKYFTEGLTVGSVKG